MFPQFSEDEVNSQGSRGMEVCQPGAGSTGNSNAVPGVGVSGADTPGHRDRNLVYSTVGTPDYIAPEVNSCWLSLIHPIR